MMFNRLLVGGFDGPILLPRRRVIFEREKYTTKYIIRSFSTSIILSMQYLNLKKGQLKIERPKNDEMMVF